MSTNACPCGSGNTYQACCEPFHQKKAKPATAEQLMRSRYAAFVKKLGDYLIETRHPSKRALDSLAQLQQTFANSQWTGLKVLSAEKGLASDSTGYVSFAASYTESGREDTLYERSLFKKEGEQWYYVEGDFNVGRNDPCWCGNGKKFKKCHGR